MIHNLRRFNVRQPSSHVKGVKINGKNYDVQFDWSSEFYQKSRLDSQSELLCKFNSFTFGTQYLWYWIDGPSLWKWVGNDKFKVIVVGGGPAGLTAAHALSRAGIDYVVPEHRPSVTTDLGASLGLWPHGLRVLAQLGLLDRLQGIGAELLRTTTLTVDAHKHKEARYANILRKK